MWQIGTGRFTRFSTKSFSSKYSIKWHFKASNSISLKWVILTVRKYLVLTCGSVFSGTLLMCPTMNLGVSRTLNNQRSFLITRDIFYLVVNPRLMLWQPSQEINSSVSITSRRSNISRGNWIVRYGSMEHSMGIVIIYLLHNTE